jgi:hypothetical protein
MVQPEGAETDVQLRFAVELVTPDAANPVGALGAVVQELGEVFTLRGELAADVPATSVASTVKL